MHYFIDGYNLLFRMKNAKDDLASQREAFIYDLNKKISLVKIDVSIVFDATSQIGGRTRSHFHELEILFTAEGETADEYILEEIHNSLSPQQETIVTSDKKLAWYARRCSARTESVEDFMSWLNRAYKNKFRQVKKTKSPVSFPSQPPSLSPVPQSKIPLKGAPLEAYKDHYERIFEAEWQEMVQQEQIRKQEAKAAQKHVPRTPRRPKDPFQKEADPEEKAKTEMDRWLKAFEKRLLKDEP